MARRPNYGAEKRQKEIQRQKKKEEKAERKRLRKEAGGDDLDGLMASVSDEGDEADEGTAEGEPDQDVTL